MWEANEIEEDKPANGKTGSAVQWVLLLAVAGVVLLLIVRGGLNGPESSGDSRAIGKTLERLELRSTADDSSLHLADIEGQIVLVNYWGPWCHYCLEEMPQLKELYQQRRDRKDFRFLSVTCLPSSQNEGLELIEQSRAYFRQKGLDFPLYTDPGASSRQALADLDREANGYPMTAILDRKCIVRGLWIGFGRGDEKKMSKLLDQLLNTK